MAEIPFRRVTRRAALLGGSTLLAGCESISDTFDSWFGERKVPLTGNRETVLSADRALAADPEDNRPVTLPAPIANADWPQVGGGLTHSPGHPALGPGLRQVWRSDIGAAAGYRRRLIAAPLHAEDTVFAMDAVGEITALDAATGRRRWSFDTTKKGERGGALGGGIAVENGTLYAVTGLAEAMSIDIPTGKVGWRVELPAPARGAPSVTASRVIIPLLDNRVMSLSKADGTEQWTYRGQPVTTMLLGLPAPAVSGDMAVAGLPTGEVVAIRLENGRAAWSEALSTIRGGGLADIVSITALPVIDNGRVVAAGLGGIIIALDLRSGRRIWERDATFAETPWLIGDWIFAVTPTATLVCLSADTGKVRWLTTLTRYENAEKKRDPITWGPPTVAGGRLIIGGSHGQMLEINPADGTTMGTTKLSGGMTLAPAIANGVLFVLTDDAQVTAYRGT